MCVRVYGDADRFRTLWLFPRPKTHGPYVTGSGQSHINVARGLCEITIRLTDARVPRTPPPHSPVTYVRPRIYPDAAAVNR